MESSLPTIFTTFFQRYWLHLFNDLFHIYGLEPHELSLILTHLIHFDFHVIVVSKKSRKIQKTNLIHGVCKLGLFSEGCSAIARGFNSSLEWCSTKPTIFAPAIPLSLSTQPIKFQVAPLAKIDRLTNDLCFLV